MGYVMIQTHDPGCIVFVRKNIPYNLMMYVYVVFMSLRFGVHCVWDTLSTINTASVVIILLPMSDNYAHLHRSVGTLANSNATIAVTRIKAIARVYISYSHLSFLGTTKNPVVSYFRFFTGNW